MFPGNTILAGTYVIPSSSLSYFAWSPQRLKLSTPGKELDRSQWLEIFKQVAASKSVTIASVKFIFIMEDSKLFLNLVTTEMDVI